MEENKIVFYCFKEKETLLIAEHNDRVAKLEEERLADLSKLGEFHRLALEQAASFTVVTPSSSSLVAKIFFHGSDILFCCYFTSIGY